MADTAEIAFNVFGAGLSAVAPGPSWFTQLSRTLGRFETESECNGAFRLVFREDDCPKVPDVVPMTWQGDFIEKRAGRVYETESIEIVEVVGHGYVAIDYSAARADVVMKAGSEDAFSFTPFMNVLDASLKAAGMNMLHGACLTVPDKSGAIAICAPSGFGKTTTSLALARAGYGLISDDASIIRADADGFVIWGLPRRLKVHRKTAAMMPWIGDLPDAWNEEDEQALSPESLQHLISIAEPAPSKLKAVLLIGPRNERGHSVEPLSKSEALVRIAQDNISNSTTGVKAWNRRHFETVATMLRCAPVLELSAGPTIETLPGAVDAALSRLALN